MTGCVYTGQPQQIWHPLTPSRRLLPITPNYFSLIKCLLLLFGLEDRWGSGYWCAGARGEGSFADALQTSACQLKGGLQSSREGNAGQFSRDCILRVTSEPCWAVKCSTWPACFTFRLHSLLRTPNSKHRLHRSFPQLQLGSPNCIIILIKRKANTHTQQTSY